MNTKSHHVVTKKNGTKVPIARSDFRTEITRFVASHGVSNDQAWDFIYRNVEYFWENGYWPEFRVVEHESIIQRETNPTSDANKVISIDVVQNSEESGAIENQASLILRTHSVVDEKMLALLSATQLAFPYMYGTTQRISATDFNQTSLFHVASNNTPRRVMNGEIMGSIGTTVIRFHGEELRHDDEITFLQLLHLARGKQPYDWIEIDTASFIKGARITGRVLGQKDRNSYDESLLRLRKALIEVVNKKRRKGFVTLNLIKELQGTGALRRIMIDPCVVALLDSYTAMEHRLFVQFRGVTLQLYKYLSTLHYEGIYPTKVMSYFEICYGKKETLRRNYFEEHPDKKDTDFNRVFTKKMSDFRRKSLPEALMKLQNFGVISSFLIDENEDKVTITKKATPLA